MKKIVKQDKNLNRKRLDSIVKFPLEIVEWYDSWINQGWQNPHDSAATLKVMSVGWITYEDKESITLTAHRYLNPPLHNSDMTIPKCAIWKRTKL